MPSADPTRAQHERHYARIHRSIHRRRYRWPAFVGVGVLGVAVIGVTIAALVVR